MRSSSWLPAPCLRRPGAPVSRAGPDVRDALECATMNRPAALGRMPLAWAHAGTDCSLGRPRALAMAGEIVDRPPGTAKAPTGRRPSDPMPQIVLCFRHSQACFRRGITNKNRTTLAIRWPAGRAAGLAARLQRTKSSSVIQIRPFQRPQVVYKQYARANLDPLVRGAPRRKDGRIGMNKSAAKKMKQRSAGKPDRSEE